ncbi:NUDIX hydrolase [Lysinibacillus sp. 2017]|uniref:NUDIX domain-containing protein n=1 Tax=unclassified Lysinibacillus TaxID=2636778 RepID=UPI000D5264C1|nr:MULTISPECIES: NUDIX domain-containing protein [unclassified Lysinibacillus]AWE08080.1 NUDIX hydrolase [Lysinibacillus sp. 2017]TGN36416.1 NUDIX domain-containing protein [Lysinibacillus sp. S2017]
MSSHIRVRAGAIIIENNEILLTVYNDPIRGIVYDLPAGGAEPNESITDTVKREAKEETCIDVEVGPLAFVYEYTPHLNFEKFGNIHTLVMMFECKIKSPSTPKFPENPDSNQIDVRWVPILELQNIEMYANIGPYLQEYTQNPRNIDLIEEHKLNLNEVYRVR